MDLTGHKRSEAVDIATCKEAAVQRGSGTDGGGAYQQGRLHLRLSCSLPLATRWSHFLTQVVTFGFTLGYFKLAFHQIPLETRKEESGITIAVIIVSVTIIAITIIIDTIKPHPQ